MLVRYLRQVMLSLAVLLAGGQVALAQNAPILTIDRLVDHVSTVPAIKGKHIDLFVRERASEKLVKAGKARPGTVVLFVHGGYSPSTAGNPHPYGMPPFAETLSDDQVAAVVTYIRTAWGNHGTPVTAQDANKLRALPLD